jgi:hypothetical protein
MSALLSALSLRLSRTIFEQALYGVKVKELMNMGH